MPDGVHRAGLHRLVVLQRQRLDTAIQVREAYQEQFRLAQRTLLDLLNSRQEQFEAEIDLISVDYELLPTSYDIFAISGTLLDKLEVDLPSDAATSVE